MCMLYKDYFVFKSPQLIVSAPTLFTLPQLIVSAPTLFTLSQLIVSAPTTHTPHPTTHTPHPTTHTHSTLFTLPQPLFALIPHPSHCVPYLIHTTPAHCVPYLPHPTTTLPQLIVSAPTLVTLPQLIVSSPTLFTLPQLIVSSPTLFTLPQLIVSAPTLFTLPQLIVSSPTLFTLPQLIVSAQPHYPSSLCRLLPYSHYPSLLCRLLPYSHYRSSLCRLLPYSHYPSSLCRLLPYSHYPSSLCRSYLIHTTPAHCVAPTLFTLPQLIVSLLPYSHYPSSLCRLLPYSHYPSSLCRPTTHTPPHTHTPAHCVGSYLIHTTPAHCVVSYLIHTTPAHCVGSYIIHTTPAHCVVSYIIHTTPAHCVVSYLIHITPAHCVSSYLIHTLFLLLPPPSSPDVFQTLMYNLHIALEAVDKSHLLLVAVEVILDLASIYPDMFTKYFTDTVDILVGWHIDLTTPPSVICYASQSLQRLSHYWANDIDFSVLMLRHFLEDTESYAEELTDPLSPVEDQLSKTITVEEKIIRVTSFIKVFNSVMKGLGQHLSPTVSPTVTWTFLYDCLARMLSVVLKMLSLAIDFELVITGNECAWLLLNLLQNKTCPAHEDLYQLLDLEISMIPQLTNTALSSTLQLVAKVVKELSANLPLELVQRILKPGSVFLELRLTPCENIHRGILAIYHSLLSLKNIPLLKEAYRLILTDLDSAYRLLVPELKLLCSGIEPTDRTTYDENKVESIVIFQLKALTDIANASNSLIGMWVLQPTILDLLASRLIPQSVGRVSPSLMYTQLYLLYSHCSRHSHFITTSSLVGVTHGRPAVSSLLGLPASDISQQSPTCGHFSVILGLLSNILNKARL
ncbi:Serine/threonine-protein kinase smg1 [Homalodisca vitripennis]|nr:Serine/threonine-protein kinase smg1 [Homalodisca vitripennis]